MKSRIRVPLTLAILLTATCCAQAESNWSWKNWNPFPAKSAKAKVVAPRPMTTAEPSMLTKFNRSSKAFFAKTKNAFPTWLMPNTQKRVRQSSDAARQSSRTIKKDARTAQRSILGPWFTPEEPEEKPTTVSDWLALPKPE